MPFTCLLLSIFARSNLPPIQYPLIIQQSSGTLTLLWDSTVTILVFWTSTITEWFHYCSYSWLWYIEQNTLVILLLTWVWQRQYAVWIRRLPLILCARESQWNRNWSELMDEVSVWKRTSVLKEDIYSACCHCTLKRQGKRKDGWAS